MSDAATTASATLEAAGDAVSFWFGFGGDPNDLSLVLINRSEDPRGQQFLPKAKALAASGTMAQGIASRKGGGALTVISRVAFDGLVTKLAAWAATHVGEHRGLLDLKDLRYVQVDSDNNVVAQQSDPLAWDALDAAVQVADTNPAVEADERTEQACETLASGAASCWFWLAKAPEDGPPTFIIIDRSTDPKGQAFAGAIKAAVAEGVPNPGSLRGIANFKPDGNPMCVGRTGYPNFIATMLNWYSTFSHIDGAENIRNVGYTQLDASNKLVERQVDPGAWEDAARADAEAAGEEIVEVTEADRVAEVVEAIAPGKQLWFWLGRSGNNVEVVMRSVDADPGRSDFDRGVLGARERLGEEGQLQESVGRARALANNKLVFQSLGEFKDFTKSLQTWVIASSAGAPSLAAIVGANFQYVNEAGNVFQDQPWPAGGKRSDRSSRRHSEPEVAAPAPAVATPAKATATLPQSEDLQAAQRATDGTRVDLDGARDNVTDALAAAVDLVPVVRLQELANEVAFLAQQVESWIEQQADLDDARHETRKLRREAWGSLPGGDIDLPDLKGDPSDAAEDARDLAGAMVDAEEAATVWRKAAKGPPFSARNPLELPNLAAPQSLREMVESIEALEKALDEACETATAPAGAAAIAEADEEAAAARGDLVETLLDLAADSIAGAEGIRSATDKLEQHGESRRAFPESLREKFDLRLKEAYTALEQLADTLFWLTR